jgi:hypothetical protein
MPLDHRRLHGRIRNLLGPGIIEWPIHCIHILEALSGTLLTKPKENNPLRILSPLAAAGACGLVLLAVTSYAQTSPAAKDKSIRPCHTKVPQAQLVDLRRRLAATRWIVAKTKHSPRLVIKSVSGCLSVIGTASSKIAITPSHSTAPAGCVRYLTDTLAGA